MKMLFLMGSVLSAAALSSCVDFSDASGADSSVSFDSWRSDCYSDSRRPAPSYVSTPSSAPNCDPRGDATQRTHHWRGHHGSPGAGHAADHPHHAPDQPRSGGGGWFGGHRGNDHTSNADGVAQHHRPQRENQASSSSDNAPNPPSERERRQEERPSERQPDPISTSLPSPQPDPAPAASAPEPAPSEPAPAPAAPEPAPAAPPPSA